MAERKQDVTELDESLTERSKSSGLPGSRGRRSLVERTAPATGSAKRPAKRPSPKKSASSGAVRPKAARPDKPRTAGSKTAGRRSRRSVTSAEAQSPSVLDYEEVARLAYFYWESRGCQVGNPEQDWFRAEEELRKRTAQ